MKLIIGEPEKSSSRSARVWIGRTAALLGIFLLALLLVSYGALWVICKGPSKVARDLFVTSCMETSFAKLFPPLVLADTEITAIQQANAVLPTEEVTAGDADFTVPVEEENSTQPDIEVVDVTGSTYKGKMIIVKDPSRVIVGTPSSYGEGAQGLRLKDMLDQTGAVAGINAGGFEDENGGGTGGIPLGIVIRDGKLLFGSPDSKSVVVGFDQKNVLHVGSMTGRQALAQGFRDAVSFGPVLVVNGKPAEFVGNGGGVNPRSVIGQRADGSVLLVAVDGRQPHSLGATYKDMAELLVKYGAVNAGNLDGGSSTMLYYQGELLNTCAALGGPRRIPTAFLVAKQ